MTLLSEFNQVNHPPHYTTGSIECIEAIEASMTREGFHAYCKGNVMKYIWRYEHKGGVESLEKARWYLNCMIASIKKDAILQREER